MTSFSFVFHQNFMHIRYISVLCFIFFIFLCPPNEFFGQTCCHHQVLANKPKQYPSDLSIMYGIPITLINSSSTYQDISRSHLPLCRGNQHSKGTWRKVTTIQHKNFICCGWDHGSFTFNRSACGSAKYGKYQFYFGSNTHYTHTGGNGCTNDMSTNRHTTITTREQYVWEPETCRLLPWDGKQFCKLLGNRRIVLLGDSTMAQQLSTLSAMIYEHQGNCANQLMLIRFDQLITDIKTMSIEEAIQTTEADIVFINGGAHYHSKKDFIEVLTSLSNSIPRALFHVPNAKIIFRGQHTGHVQCQDISKPLAKYEAPTRQRDKDPFEWHLHQSFDEAMEKMVKKLRNPHVTYWNTYPIYLRPDAHSYTSGFAEDCLHFAMPGALDIESNLLLTKLFTEEL